MCNYFWNNKIKSSQNHFQAQIHDILSPQKFLRLKLFYLVK